LKRVAILGSTGSVGVNALRLIAEREDRFDVVALSAAGSQAALVEQARRFAPSAVCVVRGTSRPADLPAATAWHVGAEGILDALDAAEPDLVLNAITGAAGLPASEWTLRRGRTLALANKESLVMAGPYLMALARTTGATILPVDSEHCAIFQCLNGEDPRHVRKLWLTASGGPFRTRALDTFGSITRAEALRHPTWDMGPRITVGSATMMNKAFEVLEARWLFGFGPAQVDVLIHPQSIVHSMVEFVDGSMLAQLGVPDMRVPILYCLGWPERLPFDFQPFDPMRFRNLEFLPVDPQRYPAVPLAYEVLERGGDSGAALNAADEVLTQAFLDGRVPFPQITRCVAEVVRARPSAPIESLDDVLAADAAARRHATAMLDALPTPP
jgi:1-deoxy-D-xylulose-5-phosphate reductoisomerase